MDPWRALFRHAWPRVVGAALAILRDLDAAEDAAQAAFVSAHAKWDADRWPEEAVAWLVTAARRRALDVLRHRQVQARFAALEPGDVRADLEGNAADEHAPSHAFEQSVPDNAAETLRLIFLCCHPGLARNAQVALTLRYVAGLTLQEIARVALVSERTMGQRIVRARQQVEQRRLLTRDFELSAPDVARRMPVVLDVLALVFNEGYAATAGDALVRASLANEAAQLVEQLLLLLPDHPEVRGLAALFAYQSSRFAARERDGRLMTLEEQDRELWNRADIARGNEHMRAIQGRAWGYYGVQAAIAACHANAADFAATDWHAIVDLYQQLLGIDSGPYVQLNALVARMMRDGAATVLTDLRLLEAALDTSHQYWSVRAEILRRCGLWDEAAGSIGKAISLAANNVERVHMERRALAIEDERTVVRSNDDAAP